MDLIEVTSNKPGVMGVISNGTSKLSKVGPKSFPNLKTVTSVNSTKIKYQEERWLVTFTATWIP